VVPLVGAVHRHGAGDVGVKVVERGDVAHLWCVVVVCVAFEGGKEGGLVGD
jgi:hypothetical protein